jgi:tetratricopeptide (TPR) repeat protein
MGMGERTDSSRQEARAVGGWDWLVVVCLSIATAVAYLPVRHAQFVKFDDPDYVTNNPVVKDGLTWAGAAWAFTTTRASNWHPLTWLSHMLDCSLFGVDPMGPHLVNVGLHIANAALLFVVLRVTTGDRFPSALTAFLFALHPAHVESVAWISERKDVLSTLFWLLTVWAYVGWVQRGGVARYAAMALVFSLGLMSKPMLVTLPFTLLLLDVWPLRRLNLGACGLPLRELRGLVVEKLPLFALVVGSSVVTAWVQHAGGAVSSLDQVPLSFRGTNALISYVRYLGILVWPVDLCVFYPLPSGWPTVSVVAAGGALLALTALVVVARRRSPYLLVGWLFFVGTLVPVLGLVQVGSQSIADRYTYVPFVGPFMMIAWGANEVARRSRFGRVATWTVGLTVVAVLAGTTYRQASTWRDNGTLFRHALSVSRVFNTHAHFEVGVELLEEGDRSGAKRHFTTILAMTPSDANAHAGLGTVLAQEGKSESAARHFEHALEADSDHVDARLNLAQLLADRGEDSFAMSHFREVLRTDPTNSVANHRLGRLLAKAGNLEEATSYLVAAVRARPNDFGFRMALTDVRIALGHRDEASSDLAALEALAGTAAERWGQVADRYARIGMPHEAAAAHHRAVRADPGSSVAHYRFGTFLAAHGQPSLAVGYLHVAVRLNASNAPARMNLATALLSLDQADDAVVQLEEAHTRSPNDARLAFHAGWLLARSGNMEAAMGYLLPALDEDPVLLERYLDLARSLRREDRRDDAVLLLDRLRSYATAQGGHGREEVRGRIISSIALLEGEPSSINPHPQTPRER